MRSTLSLTAIGLIWATSSFSQGVPTVDRGLIVRNEAANLRREADLARQTERLSTAEAIAAIEAEQLSSLVLAGQRLTGVIPLSHLIRRAGYGGQITITGNGFTKIGA